MSNQMMRDLAISVISEANEIEKADSAGEKSPRKRPNFYNRRPPTLQLPRPPPPPPPSESKKRDKNVRPVREVFGEEFVLLINVLLSAQLIVSVSSSLKMKCSYWF